MGTGFRFIHLFVLYVCMFCLHVCLFLLCVPKKRPLETLELELQMVVSHQVDVRTKPSFSAGATYAL